MSTSDIISVIIMFLLFVLFLFFGFLFFKWLESLEEKGKITKNTHSMIYISFCFIMWIIYGVLSVNIDLLVKYVIK